MRSRKWRALSIYILLVMYIFNSVASAQELVIKPRTYKALQDASEDLDRLEKFVEKHAEEQSAVILALQMKAHLYMQKGEFAKATREYQRALAQDSLATDIKNRLHLDIARSYMVQELYTEALSHLKPALDVPEVESRIDAMLLLGRAYHFLQNFSEAQVWLEKGIAAHPSTEEGWYQLLLYSYHQQGKYQKMERILPKIVFRYPNQENYWQQWAGALMHLEQFAEASAVLEMAYHQGVLVQESHILQLAAVIRQSGIPAHAATLLENAMAKKQISSKVEHWELIADTWQQAGETGRAKTTLIKALTLKNAPQIRRKLVQNSIDSEDWKTCISQLEKLQQSTHENEKPEIYMQLGYCAYYDNSLQLAVEAFENARQSDATRKAASDWLSLLQKK